MISFEKALEDITHVRSWSAFQKITEYIENHQGDFTADQFDELVFQIEKRGHYFDPQDCSIVQSITLRDAGVVVLRGNQAIGECEDAHLQGSSLPNWLFQTYSNLTDFEIREREISEYERRLATEIFGPPGSKRARATPEEVEEGVVRLDIDKAAIATQITNLREDLTTEGEDLRRYLEEELRKINNQIVKLRSGTPVTKEEVEKPYQKSETFDTLEYRILTRELSKTGTKPLLLRVFREGKNAIRVVFQGKEEEITQFLTRVEELATIERDKRAARATGYTPKLSAVEEYPHACAYYTAITGNKCNRYVAWLARHILGTLETDFNEHFDEQTFDWKSVDWTLGAAGPMNAEKAEEAFAAWLAAYRSEKNQHVTPRGDSLEELYSEFLLVAEYLALLRMKERYGRTSEEQLHRAYDLLTKEYHMTPSSMYRLQTEADEFFKSQQGTSLESEIEDEIEKLKESLGIGD